MDLKKFMEENRIKQKELAELFGCEPSNVSNIVNGKRNLTLLHVRLLIEKYGLDVISKYADPGELPNTINIDMRDNDFSNNQGTVQNGVGNQMSSDPALVTVMKLQTDQISSLIEQQRMLIEQQNRLIALLEKK